MRSWIFGGLAAVAVVAGASPALAQPAIGSFAPELGPGQQIQGEKVNREGRVVVLDFFATW